MRQILATALAFLAVSHSPVLAATVNVNTTVSSEAVSVISAVDVLGLGGSADATFADYLTAPDLADTALALEAARIALGLPLATAFTNLSLIAQPEFTDVIEGFTSNFNPVDHPDKVLGDAMDPDNYFLWIAIGDQDVNVEATFIARTINPFLLTATVVPPVVAPLPQPPGVLAMATAMGLLGLARWRRRAARAAGDALHR
jgi:hypothetical protein